MRHGFAQVVVPARFIPVRTDRPRGFLEFLDLPGVDQDDLGGTVPDDLATPLLAFLRRHLQE